MRVLRSDPLRWGPLRPHGSAITIGVFDGVHRGHRKVIEELTRRAAADRLDTVTLTFDRHPLELVAPERAPRLLSSVEDRLRLFEQLGVDVAGVLPFDEVRSMEAESFVEGVLVRALGARLVAVGTDFRFGHDRRGDVALLKTMGERFGFEVDEVPLLSEGEGPMSSSRIRAMLEAADVVAACEALGRPFALSGVVVHGDGRGRSIGVATANLEVDERLALPATGVYAAFAETGGATYKAAVNVGIRPTFDGERLIVEAHLLDAPTGLDLYGETLTLHFVDRIRPERRFPGVDELVAQIRADIDAVRIRLERAAARCSFHRRPIGYPGAVTEQEAPPALETGHQAMPWLWRGDLSKVFKDDTGIHDLDLEIPPGTIFGFVGPSGSGKTTTVRLLTGLTRPTAGSIEVLGSVPTRFSSTTKSRIGYLPQLSALYPQLTVRQNLTFAASIAGLPWFGRSAALRRVIEFVELDGSESKTVTEISGGMQRRLGLAATLVHDPELLFLDEPTAGIDPVLRRKFWDHFADMRDGGRTVFVTTQYVGEAEHCDLVALIVGGRLVMMDTPEGLRRAAAGGDVVHVRFASVHGPETIADLASFDGGIRVRPLDERSLELVVPDAARAIPDLVSWAQERGLDLEEAEEHRPPFDDVFVTLVERARGVEAPREVTGGK